MASRHIRLNVAGPDTRIHFERNILGRVGSLLRAQGESSTRVWVVTGSGSDVRFGETLLSGLEDAGYAPTVRVMPGGESAKTLEVAAGVFEDMVAHSMDRSTLVLGLGGGVICDLAGYIAAGYLRGVPLALVPTTLLAQVDASVGGKCAVNVAPGKNNVGTVYHAGGVFVDPGALDTLPEREIRSGLAEVVKFGAVLDPEFLDLIEAMAPAVLRREPDALDRVVERALLLKCRAVERDPGGTGSQEFLHFGHTLAGAIEVLDAPRPPLHGEAVAVGMAFAAHLGVRLGVTSRRTEARLEAVLRSVGLPAEPMDLDPALLQQGMLHDKKVFDGRHRFVLLEELGHPVIRHSVAPSEVVDALRSFVGRRSAEGEMAVCA